MKARSSQLLCLLALAAIMGISLEKAPPLLGQAVPPDIRVTAQVHPNPPLNEPFELQVYVQNLSPQTVATETTTLTVTLPEGFSVTTFPDQPWQGTCTFAQTTRCQFPRIGTYPSGILLKFTGKTAQCTGLRFIATIETPNARENKMNNSTSASAQARCSGGSTGGGNPPPPPGGERADLSVVYQVGKSGYKPGEIANYRISVYNKGPNTASNVTMTFMPDPGFLGQIEPSQPLPDGCSLANQNGILGISCVIRSLPKARRFTKTVGLQLPRLMPCMRLPAPSVPTGALTATLTASFAGTDAVQGNNTFRMGTNVLCEGQADLSVSQIPDRSTAERGDRIVYAVSIKNEVASQGVAKSVFLDLRTPPLTTVGALDPECRRYADNGVVCFYEELDVGDEVEVDIPLTVKQDAPCNAMLESDAQLTSLSRDNRIGNNTFTAHTRVHCPGVTPPPSSETADLSVTHKVEKPEYMPGDTVRFELSVYNKGPQGATDVEVLHSIPHYPGAPFEIGSLPSGCVLKTREQNSKIISCLFPFIAKNMRETRTLSFTIPQAVGCYYRINTSIVASFSGRDPVETNNRAAVQFGIACDGTADLALTPTVDRTFARPGEQILYRLEVLNGGPHNARNVYLDLRRPQFARVDAIPSACTKSFVNGMESTQIVCREELLETQDKVFYEFPMTVLSTAPCNSDLQHWTELTSLAFDPNRRNNSTDTRVKVSCSRPDTAAALMVTQTVNADKVLPGRFVRYQLSLRNAGTAVMGDIEVKDTYNSAPLVGEFSVPNCRMQDGPRGAVCLVSGVQPGLTRDIRYKVTVPGGTRCGETLTHAISASVGGTPVPTANIGAISPVRIACGTTDMSLSITQVQRISTGVYRYRAHVFNRGPGAGQKSKLTLRVQHLTLTDPTQTHLCRVNPQNPGEALVCDFPSTMVGGNGAIIEFTARTQCGPDKAPTIRGAIVPETTLDPQPGNNSASISVPCS